MIHVLALALAAQTMSIDDAGAAALAIDRVAISAEGGISLGAYEAGLNWATLSLLRARRAAGEPVELVAATGASAGNVNALLSAHHTRSTRACPSTVRQHYLFPRICHVHCRALAPIVPRFAEEHGLPYVHHGSFFFTRSASTHARKRGSAVALMSTCSRPPALWPPPSSGPGRRLLTDRCRERYPARRPASAEHSPG